MSEIAIIGLDLAKSVFQIHALDAEHQIVLRRQLRRKEMIPFFENLSPCIVAMEACPGAHHWGRTLRDLGHESKLIPPKYVKPFVKRVKNDAADAEAIAEAALRPSMRFVTIKTVEQQAALMLHRARETLTKQRTAIVNSIRAHLAEFGIIEGTGAHRFKLLLETIEDLDHVLPEQARETVAMLTGQLEKTEEGLVKLNQQIVAEHRTNPISRRLETIPGIGPITATAIAATVPDAHEFKNGRAFAAWLGLTPRQFSTGGRSKLGSISKQGNAYIRCLLIIGANAILRWKCKVDANPWLSSLKERKPHLVVAVALANKMARIVWAILKKRTVYQAEYAKAA